MRLRYGNYLNELVRASCIKNDKYLNYSWSRFERYRKAKLSINYIV